MFQRTWYDSSLGVTRDPRFVRSLKLLSTVITKTLLRMQTPSINHPNIWHQNNFRQWCTSLCQSIITIFQIISSALQLFLTAVQLWRSPIRHIWKFPPTGFISSSCLIVSKYQWLICKIRGLVLTSISLTAFPHNTLEAFTCKSSLL